MAGADTARRPGRQRRRDLHRAHCRRRGLICRCFRPRVAVMREASEAAHRALVGHIEELSRAGIASCDPQGQLSRSTADAIVQVLVEALYDVLVADGRGQLSDDDRAYIREMTRRLTRDRLPKPSKRFSVSDRVVCLVGGERGWAAGTVQALDQDGIFPYVVKLDPPDVRLVSVPTDTPEQA